MSILPTESLLFSKWTKENPIASSERFYLVVACLRDKQGQVQSVMMQQIDSLQEQQVDCQELLTEHLWHRGWR